MRSKLQTWRLHAWPFVLDWTLYVSYLFICLCCPERENQIPHGSIISHVSEHAVVEWGRASVGGGDDPCVQPCVSDWVVFDTFNIWLESQVHELQWNLFSLNLTQQVGKALELWCYIKTLWRIIISWPRLEQRLWNVEMSLLVLRNFLICHD